MSRDDLLALDDESLVALANRGLVKRARKEVDRGEAPAVELIDGTLHATFDDGVHCELAPGVALQEAPCSCAASRLCRHRLAAVMAFRALAPAAPVSQGRPALEVDDALLESRLGARAVASARRLLKQGLTADVRLGDGCEVLLPTCTVRFLVPWDLAHVRCDCTQRVDCPHVALAVWALQEVPDVQVDGERRVALGASADGNLDTREALQQLVDDLITQGWAGAQQALERRLEHLRAALARENAVWLVDLCHDLSIQLVAYDDGEGGADVEALGALVGELSMRIAAGGSLSRGQLAGEGTSGSTKLDHTTLEGLGARYKAQGKGRLLEVFVREGPGADSLVLEKRVAASDDGALEDGHVIGGRKLAGAAARAVAAGRVVTKAATRTPNRVVSVGGRGAGQTAVLPGSGKTLLDGAESLATVRQRLSERAPVELSTRVRAWQVVVVRYEAVQGLSWDPGRQMVWALLVGGDDEALVLAEHTPAAPGRPGATAQALKAGGPGAMVAEARLQGGRLVLEPLLVGLGDVPVAVDLAPLGVSEALPLAEVPMGADPVAQALADVRGWLCDVARRGLGQLGRRQRDDGRGLAKSIGELGLTDLAHAVDAVSSGDQAQAWSAAWARMVVLGHVAGV